MVASEFLRLCDYTVNCVPLWGKRHELFIHLSLDRFQKYWDSSTVSFVYLFYISSIILSYIDIVFTNTNALS